MRRSTPPSSSRDYVVDPPLAIPPPLGTSGTPLRSVALRPHQEQDLPLAARSVWGALGPVRGGSADPYIHPYTVLVYNCTFHIRTALHIRYMYGSVLRRFRSLFPKSQLSGGQLVSHCRELFAVVSRTIMASTIVTLP